MKIDEDKKLLIEQLKKTPIVQITCEITNISRASYYRWRANNKEFKQKTDEAIKYGNLFINDIAESQLISAIKDKNMTAIIYWLNNHHPSYSNNKVYLSEKDKQELIKTVISSNPETALQLISKNVIKGKIPRFFFYILRSIINSSSQIKDHENEAKKIEVLSKFSAFKKKL